MGNQVSLLPFGTDATKIAGYAIATQRLGNVDFEFENVGDNDLAVKVAQLVSGNPSSYVTIIPMFTVKARGVVTKSAVINSQQIAFFGSGNTQANVTPAFRNPGDLRGASFDIMVQGPFGYGYNLGFPTAAYEPIWPPLPTDT